MTSVKLLSFTRYILPINEISFQDVKFKSSLIKSALNLLSNLQSSSIVIFGNISWKIIGATIKSDIFSAGKIK